LIITFCQCRNKQNMVWTQWCHFPDSKAILLFPSNGIWSARLERLTRAYIFMPGVGMAGTHFLSPCFWFLCHIVEANQIHLDMMSDISKKLTYLLQIQHCSYCICMLQLQPEKRENGIQLMWFTLLILRLPSPSLTPKRFFK